MNAVSHFFRHLDLGKKIAAFHTVSRCAVRLHRAIAFDSNSAIPWRNPEDEWSGTRFICKTIIIPQILTIIDIGSIVKRLHCYLQARRRIIGIHFFFDSRYISRIQITRMTKNYVIIFFFTESIRYQLLLFVSKKVLALIRFFYIVKEFLSPSLLFPFVRKTRRQD